MKNFLAPIMKNNVVSSLSNYCVNHKSSLLATGTIGSSIATTAVVYRNSPLIHAIIWDTRDALDAANNDEEKKAIYKAAIKSLALLVAPIIIFQAATVATVIITKKDSDKKDKLIAELSSAAVASAQIISEYEQFKKEAEAQLGEKKLAKIEETVNAKKGEVVDVDLQTCPGEFIFRDVYCGHIFKGTKDTVKLACERMHNEMVDTMDSAVFLNGEYYQTLGVDDTTICGEHWGYFVEFDNNCIRPEFIATEIEVNGTKVPGYNVHLYPEPDYINN